MSDSEDIIDMLLVERLEEFFGDTYDPWDSGFNQDLLEVEGLPLIDESYSETVDSGGKGSWSAEKHAGRILFLTTSEKDLEEPIVLDCKCDRGHVYPEPILIDGWHRYFAHRALGRIFIPVSFSGRVDLKEYLAGETDERPE